MLFASPIIGDSQSFLAVGVWGRIIKEKKMVVSCEK